MNSKILLISGRKQSGKNTLASYIQKQVFENYGFDYGYQVKDGELTRNINKCPGTIDLAKEQRLCRQLSFAAPAKKMLVDIMGVSRKSVYGTDAEKNEPTKYTWQNMPGLSESSFAGKAGYMSGRDLMKYFLTEIFRKIDPDIPANAAYNQINKMQTQFAIFNDNRYANEIEIGKKLGAKIIRLTRTPYPEDMYDSEVALEPYRFDWKNFDAVIYNQDMTEKETFSEAWRHLKEWEMV